ncbi:hypothetical protein [Spongiactinospora sp. TRM90649]|uniref:hypothetical protein n=1 Tax=Spongiactinospora sp. TRM90649 TaxID=3031114 RepID=UPI0023F6B376|nr:hypothetical protein [Spongiactinospora sp. TRM90649]MDF5756201.1 hypothetical protein [Spongiactinospora sp. TRM90649]
MPYIPGVEILLFKGFAALKALLAAKGAVATTVAHQAGSTAIQALGSNLFGQSAMSLLPALSNAVAQGAAVLVIGGATYTVAEVAAYVIAQMRGEGYSDAQIRTYLQENYNIEWG